MEDEIKVNWPQDAKPLTGQQIKPQTPIMSADLDNQDDLALVTFQQLSDSVREIIEITGQEIAPLVGGDTSGTALTVPAGPTGEVRTADVASGKWYNFGSGPVQATADKRWRAFWNGTTWSLVDMGELPDGSAVAKDWAAGTYTAEQTAVKDGVLYRVKSSVPSTTGEPGISEDWEVIGVDLKIMPKDNAIEDVIINNIEYISGNINDNFPQQWLFIPDHGVVDTSMFINTFQLRVNNNEVGRKIEFFILNKNSHTNEFSPVWRSGNIEAESGGVQTLSLDIPVYISEGQYIGASVNYINSANSLAFFGTGGPSYSDYGGFSIRISGSEIVIGNEYATTVESKNRGFDIKAYATNNLFVGANLGNKPKGFVRLNSLKQIPKEISSESDYWVGKKAIWVGTSIPAGSGDGYKSYPEYVADILNCTVVNESVGSSGIIWDQSRALSLSATSQELIDTFGSNYANQSYEHKIIGRDANLLVLDHGYNDRNQASGIRLGSIDSLDRTTFYGAFNYVIQKALEDNPNLFIIFITPPNRFSWAPAGQTTTIIDNVRTALKNLALKYNSPYLDLATTCGINEFNISAYKSDGIHPLNSDRPRLGSIIASFIRTIS